MIDDGTLENKDRLAAVEPLSVSRRTVRLRVERRFSACAAGRKIDGPSNHVRCGIGAANVKEVIARVCVNRIGARGGDPQQRHEGHQAQQFRFHCYPRKSHATPCDASPPTTMTIYSLNASQ